MLCFIR